MQQASWNRQEAIETGSTPSFSADTAAESVDFRRTRNRHVGSLLTQQWRVKTITATTVLSQTMDWNQSDQNANNVEGLQVLDRCRSFAAQPTAALICWVPTAATATATAAASLPSKAL